MKRLYLMIFLLLSCTASWAVNMANLYRVELPVVTQSGEERAEAAKVGFERVLVRLSGDPDIVQNAVIKSALKKPEYFVEEFSYSSSPLAKQADEDALPGDNELSSSQYFIHMRYNKVDVDRLLQKAGVAHWGGTRPLVLVWMTVGSKTRSLQIIGNETAGPILGTMRQDANHYGLPLIFPMMDMADISLVSALDVKNQTLSILKEAGKRYQPDAYLIGNVLEENHQFQSEWLLVMGDQRWGWSLTGKTMEQISTDLLKEVTKTLAKNDGATADSKSPGQWIKLNVFNIQEGGDLAQLTQYLKQISTVRQIQLSEVSDDRVELSVQIQGKIDAFQASVSVDKRLSYKADDSTGDKLVYEWVR